MTTLTSLVDNVLVQYKEHSNRRIQLLSMFFYFNRELQFYSKYDLDRVHFIAQMLDTYCKANCFTEHDIESLLTIYNLVADSNNTTKYRLLADYNAVDVIFVTSNEQYTAYVIDEIHDVCDVIKY